MRTLNYTESSIDFDPDELLNIDPSLDPKEWLFICKEGNYSDTWWFEHKLTGETIGVRSNYSDNSYP